VLEAGSLQPEGLPARPGTDLDHLKIRHPALLRRYRRTDVEGL
jgi:hypothetical protein